MEEGKRKETVAYQVLFLSLFTPRKILMNVWQIFVMMLKR